jgi:hypothetical protein
MRYRILSAIIGWTLLGGWTLLAPGTSAAQQRVDPQLPGRTVSAAIGVRDAGDLDVVWVGELGARLPITRRVNGGLTVSAAEVPELLCPDQFERNGPCPTGGWLVGLDLNLEFYYDNGVVHPYGVVSLGVGHLRLPDEGVRESAFAYSTGLGLGARAGRRVWLFLEGRWRQEHFDSYSAHGLAGALGGKWGF